MTATRVWLNGTLLGTYKGGYTPFSFELTPHLNAEGANVLAVEVDSTERADIPPFGNIVDYLTFGGIYREVSLRVVPASHLHNIFVEPRDVMGPHPSLAVHCHLEGPAHGLRLEVAVLAGDAVVARGSGAASLGETTLVLQPTAPLRRWDTEDPFLHEAVVRLYRGAALLDEDRRRFGIRDTRFTDKGFVLNGRPVKLRGLNRHQTYPYVGGAMAARGQREDALVLRRKMKINVVRTSHYPQSRHFLDCCDEIGLLVIEEIPGWQHIGDAAWKETSVDNVRRMIERDWNHPSIILWGVRINESVDDHDFYVRTNALSHALDPSRPTGGIRYLRHSERLEDVFTLPAHKARALELDRWGEKSFQNLVEQIERAKTPTLARFLHGIGIRHVGEETAKDLAAHFGSLDALRAATPERLLEVDGVGEEVAASIVAFFARRFGPFPYEKLWHVQSASRFGGMENASAIFYADNYFRTGGAPYTLVAHETAHQSNSTDDPMQYGPQPSTMTPSPDGATSCSLPLYVMYR